MQCHHIKANGQRCKVKVREDSNLCFWHSTKTKRKRQKAQSKGGTSKKIAVRYPLPPVKIRTTNDIVKLLEDTINAVRGKQLDVKIANCLGYLSAHILKALEISDIEKRLSKIEEKLEKEDWQ